MAPSKYGSLPTANFNHRLDNNMTRSYFTTQHHQNFMTTRSVSCENAIRFIWVNIEGPESAIFIAYQD